MALKLTADNAKNMIYERKGKKGRVRKEKVTLYGTLSCQMFFLGRSPCFLLIIPSPGPISRLLTFVSISFLQFPPFVLPFPHLNSHFQPFVLPFPHLYSHFQPPTPISTRLLPFSQTCFHFYPLSYSPLLSRCRSLFVFPLLLCWIL